MIRDLRICWPQIDISLAVIFTTKIKPKGFLWYQISSRDLIEIYYQLAIIELYFIPYKLCFNRINVSIDCTQICLPKNAYPVSIKLILSYLIWPYCRFCSQKEIVFLNHYIKTRDMIWFLGKLKIQNLYFISFTNGTKWTENLPTCVQNHF